MRRLNDLVINLFRFHKMKMFATLMFTLFFIVVLFPYNDLRDTISRKVNDLTDKSLYIQFKKMGWSPFFGLNLEDVLIEGTAFPAVTAGHLTVTPWLGGLLSAKKGGDISAEGIFKGQATASLREGEKNKAGQRKQAITIEMEKIALQALSEYLRNGDFANISMQGAMDLKSSLTVDPNFETQPGGVVDLNIVSLNLPNLSVQTPLGPLLLPPMKWDKATFKGKLSEGKLQIDELIMGNATKDDIAVKINGDVNLLMRAQGGAVRPDFTGYDLKLDLNVKESFLTENKATIGGLLQFLDKFKTTTPNGSHYALRMKLAPGMSLPEMTAL